VGRFAETGFVGVIGFATGVSGVLVELFPDIDKAGLCKELWDRRIGDCVVRFIGIVRIALVPMPDEDSRFSSPPIRCARLREIVSPRPVPPYNRAVDESPWRKGVKSEANVFSSIPTPESFTIIFNIAGPVGCSSMYA